MHKLITSFSLTLLLTSASVAAQEAWDLKCVLDSGEQMTLSHAQDTVYLAFLAPGNDPDEGGTVMKLSILTGEAHQALTHNAVTGTSAFTLRGTGDDIDGAIAVTYEEYKGKPSAYYSVMNSLGTETQSQTCKPDTIKHATNLLETGIDKVPPLH